MMSESERPGLTTSTRLLAVRGTSSSEIADDLATEEPLEIRLAGAAVTKSVAVTMRTPGNDFELAAGFLFSEGVVRSREEITTISYCIDPEIDREQQYNIVNVTLAGENVPALERLERHFTINSACGVCGKATIEALQTRAGRIEDSVQIDARILETLPERMRQAQRVFAATGGLHAAALFDERAQLLALREDVGRHNAVDKVLGWAFMQARLPLHGCMLLVSGRASFELVQKSIVAGIPILCAVSAPSSLAVRLADAFGLTLIGFLRQERANVYTGRGRIML